MKSWTKKNIIGVILLFVLLFIFFEKGNIKNTIANYDMVNGITIRKDTNKPFYIFLKGQYNEELYAKMRTQEQSYYIEITSEDEFNNILQEYELKHYKGVSLELIDSNYFEDNKLYAIFEQGTAGSIRRVKKIKQAKERIMIEIYENSPIDQAITTDCVLIGVSKEFAKDRNKLDIRWRYSVVIDILELFGQSRYR